jgi:sterol desaturase/sphingolipid hydroxylase (fatty acid hydroxylase superfamily)
MEKYKLILEVICLGSFYFLEWLFPFFQGRMKHARHSSRNIFIGLLNALIVSLGFSWASVGILRWTVEHQFGLLYFMPSPEMGFAFVFLSFDLWMNLWHRLNHRVPFFWKFHRVHHSDTEMDASTAIRFHPGEIILSVIFRLPIYLLLGITFEQLVIYEMVLQVVILFHHSNINLPEKYDRVLRAIIVTPNMHRVHHSDIVLETDSNYSTIFSFWDRILGTFRKREDTGTIRIGLKEYRDEKWQTLPGILKTPFIKD